MSLFYNLEIDEKNKLLKKLKADILDFKKGSTILTTQTNPYVAYLMKGCLKIVKEDYNGNSIICDVIHEGETFGSILSNLNKETYIEAFEDCKVVLIEYYNIFLLEDSETNFIFLTNLMKITNSKMSNQNDRLFIMDQKTIRNRLLTYFDIVSSKNRSKNIYLDTSFTELATYLSVDRSAMSRELSHLKEEGFIEVKGKRITLLHKTRFDKDYENIHF